VTGILIAFVIVLLVPLFVSKWRTSLFGLALQGALLAAIAYRQREFSISMSTALTLVDLVLVRAVVMPSWLFVTLRRQNAPIRNDVIAPNLFSWAMALALVVIAFRAADVLVPAEGNEQSLVAVSAAALLLGLFVLATARGKVSQVIGLMRVENAIALFELSARVEHASLAIRTGQTAIMLVSVGFCRWYLAGLAPDPVTSLTSLTSLPTVPVEEAAEL
jgi:hydrogenase-4 component E